MGDRVCVRFGTEFVRATVSRSPSQMCVFSQVLVVPKLCVNDFVDVHVCLWVCIHV